MSGRKNFAPAFKVVSDGDMSGQVIGTESTINWLDNAGYQVKWDGDPVGEFYVDATINDEDWEALDFGSAIVAAGVPGSFLINMNQLPYLKIRLRYEATSGDGALNAWVAAKMV